jgi:glutamate formiminotransferase
MFECVINISEGRDAARLAAFELSAGNSLRDRHSDKDHNRSVFTLINEAPSLRRDVRSLVREVVDTLDLRNHEGAHPRLGVVDVVPFVALAGEQADAAQGLRDETAQWMGSELAVPCFLYGPIAGGSDRTLPDVRRGAFRSLLPDYGPSEPHPRAGACAVGARGVLVAWNMWIEGLDIAGARQIAGALRSDSVRALGLELAAGIQVSCNLIDVTATRPSEVYDRVVELLPRGARIERCELVGLAPRSLLEHEDASRWAQLDLSADRTIEGRLGR